MIDIFKGWRMNPLIYVKSGGKLFSYSSSRSLNFKHARMICYSTSL